MAPFCALAGRRATAQARSCHRESEHPALLTERNSLCIRTTGQVVHDAWGPEQERADIYAAESAQICIQ